MKAVFALISRNRKLFFKDRGMFFSALITPGILILLYATFLANVYRDSFVSAIPDMITISDKLIDGTVAAQLAAALLAVSCVTVTFCVNLTMVQDRANGTRKDFNVSPISKAQLYLGYFLSTVVNSLLVNGLALVLCLGYMYKMGWYMSAVDVLWVLLDEILLVLFGSTLSSIVSFPLTTQGQLSAVGTIVSAGLHPRRIGRRHRGRRARAARDRSRRTTAFPYHPDPGGKRDRGLEGNRVRGHARWRTISCQKK